MRLTKLEAEILHHRLEVPQAIAETLELDSDETESHCRELISLLPELPDLEGPGWMNPFVCREILADCVEGSTFIAALMSDHASPQRISAAMRAMEAVASKVGSLCGKELEPAYQ